MTTFDLTRTAIEGGTVIVKESRPGGNGTKTYTARILSIKSGSVKADYPYKTDRNGRRYPAPTRRRFVITFEEI